MNNASYWLRELLSFAVGSAAERIGADDGHPSDVTRARISEHLPAGMRRVFDWWFLETVDSNLYYYYGIQSILDDEHRDIFVRVGLVKIAGCGNGDDVVIDTSDPMLPVLICSHEGYTLDEPNPDPRKESVRICDSLTEFMLRIADQKFLPWDFNDAMGWRAFLDGKTADAFRAPALLCEWVRILDVPAVEADAALERWKMEHGIGEIPDNAIQSKRTSPEAATTQISIRTSWLAHRVLA